MTVRVQYYKRIANASIFIQQRHGFQLKLQITGNQTPFPHCFFVLQKSVGNAPNLDRKLDKNLSDFFN